MELTRARTDDFIQVLCYIRGFLDKLNTYTFIVAENTPTHSRLFEVRTDDNRIIASVQAEDGYEDFAIIELVDDSFTVTKVLKEPILYGNWKKFLEAAVDFYMEDYKDDFKNNNVFNIGD